MYVSDAAIRSSSFDSLDRKEFAKSLGEEILKSQTKESLVIGILGEWGSGKTSIINMAVERIGYYSASSELKKPIIVDFNPWNYSEQNQLIYQFFNQLSLALKMSNLSDNLKKAGDLLKIFGTVLSLGTLIPTVGQPALFGYKVIKSGVDVEKNVRDLLDKDLNGIKRQISAHLKKMDNKIIIVIDDIDRLNDREIRQVFQLVKSLADFPNKVYILSFDRNIVIDALKNDQFHYGEEYLEKIVQIPLTIPLMSKQEIEEILFGHLSELIESPINEIDKIHWADICQYGFKAFFTNIRDVNRYINVVTFYFQLLKEDVNIIDFFAITALQVFYPDVYLKIRDNKEVLTGSIGLNEHEKSVYRNKIDGIINSSSEDTKEFLKRYLMELFPKTILIYAEGSTVYNEDTSWRQNLRICSEEVFDTFFKFSLSGGDIRQSEIKSILVSLNKPDNVFLKINELKNSGKILTFLHIFPDHIDDIQNESVKFIVASLMDLGDSFPDDEMLLSDKHLMIRSCINSLLGKLESDKEKFTILQKSFNEATRSLYTLVKELDYLEIAYNRYHNVNEDNFIKKEFPKLDPLLDTGELIELKKIFIKKIKSWAEDEKLYTHPKIFRIIKKWKDFEDEGTDFNNVIGWIVKSNENLINFISSSVDFPSSSSLMDASKNGHSGYYPDIDLNVIGNFINLQILKHRLNEIYWEESFNSRDEREKRAVKLYMDYLGGIKKNTKA
jgi:predicted KAP-like P-loop ATPase